MMINVAISQQLKLPQMSLIFLTSGKPLVENSGSRDIWDGYEYVDKRKWGSQRKAITHAEGSSAQLKLMRLQPKTCTGVSDFLPHVIQMEKCSHYRANAQSHIIQCISKMKTLSVSHH